MGLALQSLPCLPDEKAFIVEWKGGNNWISYCSELKDVFYGEVRTTPAKKKGSNFCNINGKADQRQRGG